MEASFKFAAEARGNPSFRSDFVYWSTEGNNDTMLSIENVSNEDVAVRVTIGFNDGAGTYRFVPVIIPRKATVGLDLKQLIAQAAQPDDKGNKIPAGATFGSLRVETADEQLNERIMVTVSIYDPVAGTCGGGCVICNGINSYDLTANPFIGAISTSQQVTATVWWDDGSNTDATLNTTFTSSNTSAISVTSTPGTSGNGMATFNAVGTSVISGRFFVTGEPVGEPPPICPASCPRTILTGPTPGTGITISQLPTSLNASSGDTGEGITVSVSPASVAGSVVFVQGTTTNPNSSSAATFTYNKPSSFTGNDLWKLSIGGTNSPSGIQSAQACVSGACASQLTTTSVPPQVLIQVLYGEAHGQAASGDTISEPAIGSSIKDRFGRSEFPGGTASQYQAVITSGQYDGINTAIMTGVQPELNVAVSLFNGNQSDTVSGSPCFFSPTAADYTAIESAFLSGTTTVPQLNKDPGCYALSSPGRQIVIKNSIPNNVNGTGVP
ncbi:MAG: hypothetical protein WBE73_15685, partial [Candidatus Acidiferrum sp.]